jgi:hypothetical protein
MLSSIQRLKKKKSNSGSSGGNGNDQEGEDVLLLSVSSRSFVVGAVQSKYPSMVNFFPKHCSYSFRHPHSSASIAMRMMYEDMRRATVSKRHLRFSFRIPHELRRCFRKDYRPERPRHELSIAFNSKLDFEQFCTRVFAKHIIKT